MRYLLQSLFLLFSLPAASQSSCDSITIAEVYLNPFDINELVVIVQNSSTEGFNYPGFKIFMDGELVGEEQVDFFVLGEDEAHIVPHDLGVVTMGQVYDLQLELWTGFYSDLECTFSDSYVLYPDDDCVELELDLNFLEFGNQAVQVTVTNLVGDLVIDTLIQNQGADEAGNHMSFCGPQSCYYMTVTPVDATSFETGMYFAVMLDDSPYWNISQNLGTAESGAFSFGANFITYYGCETSVEEFSSRSAPIIVSGNSVVNVSERSVTLDIFDLKGAVIRRSQVLNPGESLEFEITQVILLHWMQDESQGAIKFFPQ